MQEKRICTIEQLKEYLKANLSEKRYTHVLNVAETTEKVLAHYKCTNYQKEWNGFSAGSFCGLGHDISRELSKEEWFEICEENGREIKKDELSAPVLLHGYVSSVMLKEMVSGVPESWLRAIEIHTVGDKDMDDLALALYIADYLEPGRTYLTDEKRAYYLACPTIQLCAYTILCDIMNHLKEKGISISKQNMEMKYYLENK